MSCTNLIEVPLTYGRLALYNSLVNFGLKTIIFWTLMALMYRYHRFEFNRTAKRLIFYFVIDIISYGMAIFIFTAESMGLFESNRTMLSLYLLNAPQIMLAYAILNLKDSKDVMQELSKLDYLLIVSIFQRQAIDPNSLVGSITSSDAK